MIAVAEDLIVFRNGDVVKANVMEIQRDDVKYKRASNPNGPVYTINKSEILSIIYENGEKDIFAESETTSPGSEQVSQSTLTPPRQRKPIAASDNALLISRINNCTVRHGNRKPNEKKFKTTKDYTPIMGITEGSVLSDENITVEFKRTWRMQYIEKGKTKDYDFYPPFCEGYCKINIKNKTSNPIYIDAANSFRIEPSGKAEAFYSGVSVTNTTGKQSGGTLGLGAVANALGVGGVVGTLAHGVGIGGGSNNSTSVTTTESNIIAIPPGGVITMPRRILVHENDVELKYEHINPTPVKQEILSKVTVNNKDKFEKNRYIPMPDSEECMGMKYYITYSTTPDFSTYYSVPFGFYIRGLFSSKNDYDEFISDDGELIIGTMY